jgi:hypothetical protein
MNSAQLGLWSRTWRTLGGATCPSCGANSGNSGMPPCRFECAPVTLVPGTSGRGSSSSLAILPTLTASRYGSSQNGQRPDGSTFAGAGKPSLERMLPTLVASDGARPLNVRGAGSVARGGGQRIAGALLAEPMLPTLTASAGERGQRGELLHTMKCGHPRGAMLPTMRASDWRSGSTSVATQESNARPLPEVLTAASHPGSGSLLDPGWCEAFMGFPVGWTDPGSEPDGPVPAYVKPASGGSGTPSSRPLPKRSAG